MSKPRVIVLSVIQQGLTPSEAAARFGVSRQWVHRLLVRYQAGGLDAVEPRSHRPETNPRRTSPDLAARIVELRHELVRHGLDAGPLSIAERLRRDGQHVPSTSTIRRILHAENLIVPAPRKRPRSSYRRFEATQPNECWQSDFTHWRLADGSDIEILNWLDAFEYLLAELGIIQKNGHPGHPQTQGKIERFHQTLKRWLTVQPPATDLASLQRQLERFQVIYNSERVHRAHDRTPTDAYAATVKAAPPDTAPGDRAHYRVRIDTVDRNGKVSLRRAGRMHHLGIGTHRAGTPVLILIDHNTVDVIDPLTGEHLSSHRIDPDHSYWRNTQRNPGRWPGSQ